MSAVSAFPFAKPFQFILDVHLPPSSSFVVLACFVSVRRVLVLLSLPLVLFAQKESSNLGRCKRPLGAPEPQPSKSLSPALFMLLVQNGHFGHNLQTSPSIQ